MHIRYFLLVAMGSVLLACCASAAPSDRARREAVAHFVTQLESDVGAMATIIGETGFQPKSQGIPHRMAAIGTMLSAIESDVAALGATIASGSATLAQLQSSSFQLDLLIDLINQTSNDAKAKLNSISALKNSVSIGDMFAMQMLMNHLSQMAEMSTAVVDAANQAILDMARDVKG